MKNLPNFETFVSESSGIYSNWVELTPAYFEDFKKAWLAKDKNNVVYDEIDYDDVKIYYGAKSKSKEGEWKYIEDEYKLYTDLSTREVWQIIRK